MIINEKMKKELSALEDSINLMIDNNSITNLQIENFLRTFEKTRFNVLSEIKLYNKTVQYEYEKIKTIDDDYKVKLIGNVLKIDIPEVMPSYKNIKTHASKRILLNIAENTKQYEGLFKNSVFIFIELFDKIQGWDVDNRNIKPVADGLILSKVITDDNITKMSYCVRGETSDKPHTEIYVMEAKDTLEFLEGYCSRKYVIS